ncbi:unnamed protein product [Clavelina lepadiformis]|uniref:CCHC-type domain-containing protein n=1 Tax=Clavelina lepadiformis TaxID=159417 RepID=A0ABP0GR80_CLALP
MDNMKCEICEQGEAAYICTTCINPAEINLHGGVLICENCKFSHHNKGIFLLHQTKSLQAQYKREHLQNQIKGFQLSSVEKIESEIVKLNVRTSIKKSNGEAARKTIHSQLMEVYNYITDQLNSKEKDLNREVEAKMSKICEKADLTRDKLKELSNNIVKSCRGLLDEISDEDKDLDETKFKSEIETLEALVRDALLGNSNDELGPYLEVDRGLFDMDHTVDIKTFRISKMSFYSASDILENTDINSSLCTQPSEDSEYVIPQSFITRTMLSGARAAFFFPHPALVSHGKWILAALQYYLQLSLEENKLILIPEHEVESNEWSVVIAKTQNSELPHLMRCVYTLQEHDDRKKGRKRWDKGPRDVIIHPIDYYEMSCKFVARDKVHFYKVIPCLEKINPLAIKVSFNGVDSPNGKVFPEISANVRRRITKQLENSIELKVKFKKEITFLHHELLRPWAAQVSLDGTNASSLLKEDDADPSKAKLCQDIRLHKGEVPVVRDVLNPTKSEAGTKKVELKSEDLVPNQTEKKPNSRATSPSLCILSEPLDPLTTAHLAPILSISDSNEILSQSSSPPPVQDAVAKDATQGVDTTSVDLNNNDNDEVCGKVVTDDDWHEATSETSADKSPDAALFDVGGEYNLLPEHMHECRGMTDALDFDELKKISCIRPDAQRRDDVDTLKQKADQSDQINSVAESDLSKSSPPPPSPTPSSMNPTHASPGPSFNRLYPQSNQLSPNSKAFFPRSGHSTQPAMPEVWTPCTTEGWNKSAQRCLRFLTLILYGENSNQFVNSAIMGEPPADIKRFWADLIHQQQHIWGMLPTALVQPLMSAEMQRFPELYEEFCRFQIPMNIFKLRDALGSNQLLAYIDKFPEIQTVFDLIYKKRTNSPQNQEKFLPQDGQTGPATRQDPTDHKDRGDFGCPAVQSDTIVDAQSFSDVTKLNCNAIEHEKLSNLDKLLSSTSEDSRGTRSRSGNGDRHERKILLKRSSSDSGMLSNSAGDYQPIMPDREFSQSETNNPRESDWIEEDDVTSGAVTLPTSSNRQSFLVCYHCGVRGHVQALCPELNSGQGQVAGGRRRHVKGDGRKGQRGRRPQH